MKARWLAVFLLMAIAGTLLDVVTTYFGSPDLRHEANPLIVGLGRRWVAVVVIKALSFVVSGPLFYAGLSLLQSRHRGGTDSTSFLAPLSRCLFHRELSVWRFFFNLFPPDMTAMLGLLLLAVANSVAVGSLIGAAFNVLTLLTSRSLVSPWVCWATMGVSGMILTFLLANIFLRCSVSATDPSGLRTPPVITPPSGPTP
jgi:hypothetical protein